jgi:hypothetical protein
MEGAERQGAAGASKAISAARALSLPDKPHASSQVTLRHEAIVSDLISGLVALSDAGIEELSWGSSKK